MSVPTHKSVRRFGSAYRDFTLQVPWGVPIFSVRRQEIEMRSNQRLLRIVLSSAFLAVLTSVFALGQEYRGRVQGTVTDSSQGAVVGAKVTLLNNKTGVASARQTSESGH